MATEKEKVMSIDQLDDSKNLDKYKTGGDILQTAYNKLVSVCKSGTSVKTLCQVGDKLIEKAVNEVYTKKKLKNGKGLAFPTCISLNNCAGYFSPSDKNDVKLKKGDLVKVEFGVHIDGFPSLMARTFILEDSDDIEDKKKKDNVMKAMDASVKLVSRLFKTSKTNFDVGTILSKVCEKYDCNLLLGDYENIHIPGVLSYQMSQNVIDGYNDDLDEDVHNFIMPRRNDKYEFDPVETEFERNQVYAMDVCISSGTGKVNPKDDTTTVYKRNYAKRYSLKMKSSRETLKKFQSKFPVNITEFNSARVKMGMTECMKHGLIEPYPVLYEKDGEYIARTVFTVIVRKKPMLIC